MSSFHVCPQFPTLSSEKNQLRLYNNFIMGGFLSGDFSFGGFLSWSLCMGAFVQLFFVLFLFIVCIYSIWPNSEL